MFARTTAVLRAVNQLKNRTNVQNQIRHSSHKAYYRTIIQPHEQPHAYKYSHYITAFAWWWVLWHLWTEPGHVFGEFDYPDASKWTDEELGVSSN